MSLNNNYVISPSLEEYFVDKTTGLPLSNGKVYFYSDINRSTLKPIFTLSGNPPNYSYVQLQNPSTLSAVGTFQDEGGNNVLPYYYPYDADGNIELYYIEVYDSNDFLQFTREAWPNISFQSDNIEVANAVNYIPNGQFLLHTDIPDDEINKIPAGQIRSDVTEIAQGGWSFRRSTGSTSTDNVSFFRYGEFVSDPSASPRYAVQILCSGPGVTDVDKGLYCEFKDVNKFASVNGQTYTISFCAETVNSGDFVTTLNLIKNYGTGGSPSATEIIQLTTFQITSTQTLFQFSFSFGDNEGKGIGDNDDDYVALELSFPTNISFGIIATDFLLTIGTVEISEYPPTTNKDFSSRSLVLGTPAYDGSDFGLPVVITKEGLSVDRSSIGSIVASIQNDIPGHLICDGSKYLTSGIDPITGIPFSRLQSALYNSTYLIPLFGTGDDFVTVSSLNSDIEVVIHANTSGAINICSEGSVPTGFSFKTVGTGAATYGVSSFWNNGINQYNNTFTIWNEDPGAATSVNVGTTGFIIIDILKSGSTLSRQITQIVTDNVAAGSYFTYSTPTTNYYVWYQIDGVGTDPAPGGTGILVRLTATDEGVRIALKTSNVLNGYTTSLVTVNNGASLSGGGKWFNLYATGGSTTQYYVWYTCDGIGTDPVVPGKIGIKINVFSSDSAGSIAIRTKDAINRMYFQTPDYRGQFLRGAPRNNSYYLGSRFSFADGIGGNDEITGVGTFEIDAFLSHSHDVPIYMPDNLQISVDLVYSKTLSTPDVPQPVTFSGSAETRPYNSAVNYFIKF